jgi:hypothetical protein
VTAESPDVLTCAICGAPAQTFDEHAVGAAARVATVICSSLLCPSNLEGSEPLEPDEFAG